MTHEQNKYRGLASAVRQCFPSTPEITTGTVTSGIMDLNGVNPDGVIPDGVIPDGVNPDDVNPDDVNPNSVNPDSVNPDGVNFGGVNLDSVNPNAVSPSATTPNATPPNATTPNATTPNAMTPSVLTFSPMTASLTDNSPMTTTIAQNLVIHDASKSLSVNRNFPADVNLTLAMFAKAVNGIGLQIFKLSHEWDTKLYELRYEYADYPAPPSASALTLPRHVRSLPKAEAFSSSKIGQLVERAHVFLRAQMPFVARFHRDPENRFADLVGHDVFRAFFNSELFPMPGTLMSSETNFWSNDDCFTDQFLNGCNPTVIKRLDEEDVPKMPPELLHETDEFGRNACALAKEKLLYVADYEVLATPGVAGNMHESGSFTNQIKFGTDNGPSNMTKHFYAPYVAFYQKDDGHLGVLGIVLTRHKDRKNDVYNKKRCPKNTYIFAKMHVACADNQVHQFYSHLGRCHIVFEPFGVAARNVFHNGDSVAQNHVVGRLLAPHFHDHFAINWLARNTLVAHGEDVIPFTDANFAIGSKGGLCLLAAKYKSWKLEDQAFPAQLHARGFDPNGGDGLCYYYRDDGMRIWRALERYVEESLKGAYELDNPDEKCAQQKRDERIQKDPLLRRWCEEMRDENRAAVQSFPKSFASLEALRDTITTIIYNVSAEHAAVNASQERYLAYVPNRPNALFKPVPSPNEEDMDLEGQILRLQRGRGDDDDIGASMPISFAFFQVQFAHLLTLPASKTLLDMKGEGLPRSATERLKKDLMRAHYEIRSRNIAIEEDTNRAPYEFLDPAQVAQSIEI